LRNSSAFRTQWSYDSDCQNDLPVRSSAKFASRADRPLILLKASEGLICTRDATHGVAVRHHHECAHRSADRWLAGRTAAFGESRRIGNLDAAAPIDTPLVPAYAPDMRRGVVIACLSTVMAFSQSNQPTIREIADAYRSKSGEGGTFIPGLRWETWRINEVRGWSLHFKHKADERLIGVVIAKYRAVAKKSGVCAEYDITDTFPFPPNNVQIKPILVVEPSGTRNCR
jgi:hypothetical protein